MDTSDSMELYFVEEVYDNLGQLIKTVELIPNGAKVRVTNATKNQVTDNQLHNRTIFIFFLKISIWMHWHSKDYATMFEKKLTAS